MRSIFWTILRWTQWIVGIVPPSARNSAVLFRVVHYTVVIALTLLLGVFTDRIDKFLVWNDLQFPDWFPVIAQRFWWGCLFLLSYIFVRLVVYLILLLRIQDEAEFADIWQAWNEGLRGLEDQRLDIRWLPVFLVNGMTRDEEQRFFQTLRLNWKTEAPSPAERSAPLRFFANEELVLISCTNVGATSAQRGNYDSGAGPRKPVLQHLSREPEGVAGGTLKPGHLGRSWPAVANPGDRGGTLRAQPTERALASNSSAEGEAAPGGTLRGTLRRAISHAVSFGRTLRPGAVIPIEEQVHETGQPVPLSQKQLDWNRRRMRFLCQLVRNERSPWSPINGMLQVAPLSWSQPSHDGARLVSELSQSVATDVETVHRAFELRFPITLLLTDFDSVEGFKEFVDRCTKREPQFRDSRAGSRFPLGRRLEPKTAAWVVTRVLDWLKDWIYRIFADDLDHSSNRRLYYLLCSLRTRQQLLQSQMERSLLFQAPAETETPVLVSGIYLSAIGSAPGGPAFGRGLLQKLIQEQDAVAWTDQSVRRDRLYRRIAFGLFVLAAILFALAAWQGLKIYQRSPSDHNSRGGETTS